MKLRTNMIKYQNIENQILERCEQVKKMPENMWAKNLVFRRDEVSNKTEALLGKIHRTKNKDKIFKPGILKYAH